MKDKYSKNRFNIFIKKRNSLIFNTQSSSLLQQQGQFLRNFLLIGEKRSGCNNNNLCFAVNNNQNSFKTVQTNKYEYRNGLHKINTLDYSLETYQRSNQDTCLNQRPTVFNGQWVQKGDLLADCAASVGGELALGQNLLIAYMPWEGYNYEDAILISERLVFDDLYTSIHIEKYEIQTRETKQGNEEITKEIPDTSPEEIDHLDSNGIVKVGSWVQEGDILVGKTTPINKKNQSPYQKLLYTILEKNFLPVRDSSLRAPKGINAKVIKVQLYRNSKLTKLPSHESLRKTKPSLLKTINKKFESFSSSETKRQIKIKPISTNIKPLSTPKSKLGKFSSTEFILKQLKQNSKEESLIQPKFQILENISLKSPFSITKLKNQLMNQEKSNLIGINQNKKVVNSGTKFTKNLKKKNPKKGSSTLNKLSASNLTVQLYLAEKRKVQVGDKLAGRHGNKGIISQILPRQDMPYLPDGTPIDMVLNPLGVPSRMNVGQIYECLLGLAGKFLGENYKVFPFDEIYGAEASRTFVYSKLNEARKKTGLNWIFDANTPGKMRLYDGRTGDCFDQAITVGQAYILRLVHMVDDKIHSRSTGPYSLVTQQPLRGRSKQGGQRLGEMEVWALEGYGAAFILLEMLTIKSDDMTGRMTLWSNLILNQEISIGTPESFKVLICELQALCIDIGLFRNSEDILLDHNNSSLNFKSEATEIKHVSSSEKLMRIENLMNLR